MITKLRSFVVANKVISVIVIAIVILGGYFWYTHASKATVVTRYVVQKATEGTVIASISGSGQVQAVNTVDVKPQVTETVTRVLVKVGQQVKAGQVLVQLDTRNEQKAVTQAQISLQSAQLSLAKLQEAPATSTLQSTQNAVTQQQEAIVTASTTLQKDYQNGFNSVSSAFVDFQTVMTALDDFTGGTEVQKPRENPDAYVSLMPIYLQGSTSPYRDDVLARYQTAFTAYQQNLADYHATSHDSSPLTLDALFTETANTAKLIGGAVKSAKDMLDFIFNNYPTNVGLAPLPAITNTFQTNFGNYTGTINGDITSVSNAAVTIISDKNALNDANLSLTQKQATLDQLIAGVDPLDVQSEQLSIQQAQISLTSAEQQLAECSVRAPIDGVVSVIDATVGETVPSPAMSIVGESEVAQVTLNEVDAAKMNVGNKATLTFDAITELSLAGEVVELDPVGTVSQGVVNYNAKIGFTQPANTSSSAQVRPGMSVTANIVTQANQNVIAVPNSAVKTQGTTKYILEPSVSVSDSDVAASASGGISLTATPKMVPVTLGLSNDTLTEITSGVSVGDLIITQTVTSASSASTATGGTNALRLLGGGAAAGGGNFGGGGTFRTGTGGR